MEVLYVVSRFPKISESFILNEIHELHERGHEVSVFSFARPEDDFYHTEVENVDVTVEYANRPSLGILPGFFSGKILNASVLREGLFLDRPLYSAYWLHVGKQIAETIERVGPCRATLEISRIEDVRAAKRRAIVDRDYRREMVDHNYKIARKFYSYTVLRRHLRHLIQSLIGVTS